ncbi:hypothetical protein ACIQNI_17905 [Streptomyces sp. NPDC091266]|uniref:hypothetical protein n=1 Tax=Streptomyces sp. NPDC091266 TaxID=3365978 RepID=UPI00381C8526
MNPRRRQRGSRRGCGRSGATQFETPFGSQMAAGALVTIPLVIVVPIFQRRIVAGLTAGAAK